MKLAKSLLLALSLIASGHVGVSVSKAAEADSVRILGDEYPRAFFFRSSESWANNPRVGYEEWERAFERLGGIMGKALEEEIPGRSTPNIEYFTRFKQRHPDQLVMLHYNGNARDPRWESGRFFAGHWIYYNGAKILSDVPAEPGETDIRVSDPSLFQLNMGRYRTSNEDVGLCMLDADGKPDWHRSEQVQLVSIDAEKQTIRVRRGCYGTKPRAFPAGRAYAAAHVTEGPWGRRSNILWFYNHSTRCPRDAEGRTCNDIHIEHLAELVSPGGPIAAFDGIEFDVLHDKCHGARGNRGPDCDADGEADSGVFNGVNEYGNGVVDFCRALRRRLGDDFLLTADGMLLRNQRAFGILNGIESEGWPHLSDYAIRDWSGGLNRHFFWRQNARSPVFNYINHKFNQPTGKPGVVGRPDLPFKIHRLVFAAGVFTDSAICYSFTPPRDPKAELVGIWDELGMGAEKRVGWLGKPLGPPVRMALKKDDVLKGAGKPIGRGLMERISSEDAEFELDGGALKIWVRDASADTFRVRLSDIPCDGPDLFVSVTARAAPLENHAPEMGRLLRVGIAAPAGRLVTADLPERGMALRGKTEGPLGADGGATFQFRSAVGMDGETHDCYFVHPPYGSTGPGYTYWERTVHVPDKARLEFFTGMGSRSPERSDGVDFIVQVGERGGSLKEVFRANQKAHEWIRREVSLAPWAGKSVRLKFISDCGPKNNATTDHSHWGDVRISDPAQARKAATKPVDFMTWANERDFTAGFYFNDVRSPAVDLEFIAEGSEPVWIREIAAYAHPDAIYREFEHGLVVANPSPHPYTFDLARLLPGKRFRRLRATPLQDTEANNGAPVGERLTLEAQEALFLVRD